MTSPTPIFSIGTGLTTTSVPGGNSGRIEPVSTVYGVAPPRRGTRTVIVISPTLITITADPNYVAYKMQPTGIRFAKPVVVTQLLRQTEIYGRPLSGQIFGAYIADDLLDLGKVLNALEIETSITIFKPSQPSLPESESWTINHFSRYMLASG